MLFGDNVTWYGLFMENLIKKFRVSSKLTQLELAGAIGWKQSRWSNYERGERTPGIEEAREIVRAFSMLGVTLTLDDIFPEKKSAA